MRIYTGLKKPNFSPHPSSHKYIIHVFLDTLGFICLPGLPTLSHYTHLALARNRISPHMRMPATAKPRCPHSPIPLSLAPTSRLPSCNRSLPLAPTKLWMGTNVMTSHLHHITPHAKSARISDMWSVWVVTQTHYPMNGF
jgi:hypothetical protein